MLMTLKCDKSIKYKIRLPYTYVVRAMHFQSMSCKKCLSVCLSIDVIHFLYKQRSTWAHGKVYSRKLHYYLLDRTPKRLFDDRTLQFLWGFPPTVLFVLLRTRWYRRLQCLFTAYTSAYTLLFTQVYGWWPRFSAIEERTTCSSISHICWVETPSNVVGWVDCMVTANGYCRALSNILEWSRWVTLFLHRPELYDRLVWSTVPIHILCRWRHFRWAHTADFSRKV